MRIFLDYANEKCSIRDYLMFHMMIYTGVRKGEIIALHWSDINFDSKTLNLNKTLFQKNGVFLSLTS